MRAENNDKVSSRFVPAAEIHDALSELREELLHRGDGAPPQCVEKLDRVDNLLHLLTDGFLEIVHDIKTPLTVIGGMAHILERHFSENEDVARYAGHIIGNSERIESLAHEILIRSDLCHHENAGDHCDAEAVILECIDNLKPVAAQRDLKIKIRTLRLSCAVDRFSLWRIVMNLVENALKYSETGGTVSVMMWPAAEEKFDVSIENTSESHHIEMAMRNGGGPSGMKGNGIGLRLCRKLAETHGAKLSIRKTGVRGLRAVLTLPAAFGIDSK